MMRHKRNPRPRKCGQCEKEFFPTSQRRKFCSKHCANKARYAYMRGYNVENGEDARLRKAYGFTLQEYERMLKEQNGCCAICGWHPRKGMKKLHVDHNHKTNQVRGLLCYRCNASLGMIDEFGFEKLRKYVEG